MGWSFSNFITGYEGGKGLSHGHHGGVHGGSNYGKGYVGKLSVYYTVFV